MSRMNPAVAALLSLLLVLAACSDRPVPTDPEQAANGPINAAKTQVPTVYVNPSGDQTGVTDWTNLTSALENASPGTLVQLGAGDFFIHTTLLAEGFDGSLRGAGVTDTRMRMAPGQDFQLREDYPFMDYIAFIRNEGKSVEISDITILVEKYTEWWKNQEECPTDPPADCWNIIDYVLIVDGGSASFRNLDVQVTFDPYPAANSGISHWGVDWVAPSSTFDAVRVTNACVGLATFDVHYVQISDSYLLARGGGVGSHCGMPTAAGVAWPWWGRWGTGQNVSIVGNTLLSEWSEVAPWGLALDLFNYRDGEVLRNSAGAPLWVRSSRRMTGMLIERNQVVTEHSDWAGIELAGASGTVVRANDIRGSGYAAIWLYFWYNYARYNDIRDNQVNRYEGCPDIYLWDGTRDNTVVGNRFTTVWDDGWNNTIIGDNPNDCAKPPGTEEQLELPEETSKKGEPSYLRPRARQ